jgi:hypothetical protein
VQPIELGKTLYVVQEGDNVAIALDDLSAGEAPLKGGRNGALRLTGGWYAAASKSWLKDKVFLTDCR